jgi:hypothetical protein
MPKVIADVTTAANVDFRRPHLNASNCMGKSAETIARISLDWLMPRTGMQSTGEDS